MSKGRTVPVLVFIIGAAVVAAIFRLQQTPNITYDRYLVGNLIGLMWVPMLSILILFREEPSKFGFSLGNWSRLWVVLGVAFMGLFMLMFYVCRWPAFQDYYPIFRRFPDFYPTVSPAFANYPRVSPWEAAPWLMLYAELSYGLYLFCWEFFFRGYLLFGLQRSIGWWAIVVQALAFGLLHYGKVPAECYASFGAGIILGIIALNAKSFVPCFVLHWVVSMTFDVMIVATRHTGVG